MARRSFVVNNQRFPAHRCLVAAASPVLRSMLTNGMKETRQRYIVLKEVDVVAWEAVLDYMYTGQMNVSNPWNEVNVDKALQCLKCADWLQMEELVDEISLLMAGELYGRNCLKILAVTDRLGMTGLRDMAMKTVVENFYAVWDYSGFIGLLFDVVLEVLRCDELVVRSELDVFFAVIRCIVWSRNSEIDLATNRVIVKKTCEVIREHTGLDLYDPIVAKTVNLGEANYDELFACVHINELSTADLQVVATICRKLCKEVQTSLGSSFMGIRRKGCRKTHTVRRVETCYPSCVGRTSTTSPKRYGLHFLASSVCCATGTGQPSVSGDVTMVSRQEM